ncbi:hypothetical protein I350_03329 [Cryptococcus amylolentus CBS 6273]|uniref:N-acetyltransferase domain-containing protein n=1 Tax=Cryptococcus amylolentus CBS 6273 TaxID=1296118 RepID=A0A1E3K3W0_9TREE|nr:hypothetical protein I350_03329 [Cryptococcus amylolentus CBS 6273]
MFKKPMECTPNSTRQWYTNNVIPCMGGESTAGFNIETFYIEDFGTRREYQGLGLGTALLSRLEDHARESGGRLGLATVDERAARLYEKAGFKDIHNAELSYEDGGETVKLRTMCNDCGLESWRPASSEANNNEDGAHQCFEEQSECSKVLFDAFLNDRFTNKLYGHSFRIALVDCEVWVTRVKGDSVEGGTTIASVACVPPPGKEVYSQQ